MPAHSMDTLFRSLRKGEPGPVYYFYGTEDVLKEEAVQAVLDRALEPAARDFNLDQRSVAQLEVDEVHTLCHTLPMMAQRRVVVLREIEAWKRKAKARSEFLRYLERPCPETLVILVQGGDEEPDRELVAGSYTVRFDSLPTERAVRWTSHRASQLGLPLAPDAAEYLVQCTGADLGALSSELAKLSALPSSEAITVARIAELVGVRRGETMWDWREEIFEGRPGLAASLLPGVLTQPGVTGVKLVTLLGTTLVGLGVVRAAYDRGIRGRALEEAARDCLFKNRPAGLLGYREEAARWAGWVARWPSGRLRAALRAALETDTSLKSTTVSDERGLLLELTLRLGMTEPGEAGKTTEEAMDGEAGKVSTKDRNSQVRTLVRALSIFGVLSTLSVSGISGLQAQTDPRLVDVIRQAQEGQGDSARTKVQRLLAVTAPGDTLYPQIIYTQAMVASDAAEMRRQLQKVAVEYSSSSWADDALLRLVQLDYASSNLEGAARNLERIRYDYPGSPLLPQAAYWAARTYFDQKNPELACRWIAEGLAGSRGNVELQNQLGYLNQRCSLLADAGAAQAGENQVQSAGATTSPDTRRNRDTTPHPKAPTPAPATPPGPPPAPVQPDTAQPAVTPPPPQPAVAETAPPAPAPPGTRFRIQVSAVRTASAAEAIARRLRARGLDAVTVEEGGLHKVRIGNYATKPEAVAALPEIKARVGGSAFVVAEQ